MRLAFRVELAQELETADKKTHYPVGTVAIVEFDPETTVVVRSLEHPNTRIEAGLSELAGARVVLDAFPTA
jgi:hypothetical protein